MILNKHTTFLNTLKCIFIFVIFAIGKPVFADELFTIEPYIDLSGKNTKNKSWLPPVKNLKSNSGMFFISTNGEIYQSKGHRFKSSPLINLSSHESIQKVVKFTAFTLHPNFHVLEEVGSNTFYTSHIEKLDPLITTNRLINNELKENHTHDAVVVEWQVGEVKNGILEIKAQREVLRIGSSSINLNVNQLSFNPYLQSWNDNFGLLHLSLKNDTEIEDNALYSGSILRIDPAKFGLKNYTIPTKNPFMNDSVTEDEILIYGLQNIHSFMWSKKLKDKLIVSNDYNGANMIAIVEKGDNFKGKEPKSVIAKREQKNIPFSPNYYSSRDLSSLRNKLLFLDQNKTQWKLKSANVGKNDRPPITEYNFSPQQMALTDELSLFIPNENEVLIWNKTQAIVFKVFPNILKDASATNTTPKVVSKDLLSDIGESRLWIYFSIALVVVLLLLFISKYNRIFNKTRALLNANFARYSFNNKTNQIMLYKRRETEVSKTLSTEDIVSSEIVLNDVSVNKVSSESGHAFDTDIEAGVRLSFAQEHRDKMVDDKTRKISLKLTTANSSEHLVCVYLREGNQRLTKEKYNNVIENLIDWSWYYSGQVNKAQTPVRPQTRDIYSSLPKNKTHGQAAIKQSETSNVEPVRAPQQKNSPAPPKSYTSTKQQPSKSSTSSANNNEANSETKIIDGLDKLVTMKEQGYITQQEFDIAKRDMLSKISK